VLAAKMILFLCSEQQMPQSMVLDAIFSLFFSGATLRNKMTAVHGIQGFYMPKKN
jgi:hypothetical protein